MRLQQMYKINLKELLSNVAALKQFQKRIGKRVEIIIFFSSNLLFLFVTFYANGNIKNTKSEVEFLTASSRTDRRHHFVNWNLKLIGRTILKPHAFLKCFKVRNQQIG